MHLYALELEMQCMWDYTVDGYVHWLIQNKADGKLVKLLSTSMGAGATAPLHAVDKLTCVHMQYASSLISIQVFVDDE